MEIASGGVELLEQIEDMWSMLTLHAASHSDHFSSYFAGRTFEERKKVLSEKAAKGRLQVHIARDIPSRRDLGYCVCTVDPEGCGEVDSLFVDELSRGRGVGNRLVDAAVKWMEENGAKRICVFTVYGSEEVLPFYARHGFLPKMLMLEKRTEQ